MSKRVRGVVALGLTLCGALATCLPMRGQTPDETLDPAYAGLKEAAAVIVESRPLDRAQGDQVTLTLKRKALEDPIAQRGLALFRRWLSGPLTPTLSLAAESEQGANMAFDALLLGETAALTEALAIEQEVAFSESRVETALVSAYDVLKLSTALHRHGLTGAQGGMNYELQVLLPMAKYLNQLGRKDCDRVMRLATEWEKMEALVFVALQRERQGDEERLSDNAAQGIAPLIQRLTPDGDEAGAPEAVQKQRMRLRALGPQEVAQIYRQAWLFLEETYSEMEETLRQPAWIATKRKRPGKELEFAFDFLIDSPMTQNVYALRASMALRQTFARLLYTHAAIRRYRWQHDRLPRSLTELRLGERGVDPYSGKPFRYEPRDDRFVLESVGPAAVLDSDGKPLPRQPLTLNRETAATFAPSGGNAP